MRVGGGPPPPSALLPGRPLGSETETPRLPQLSSHGARRGVEAHPSQPAYAAVPPASTMFLKPCQTLNELGEKREKVPTKDPPLDSLPAFTLTEASPRRPPGRRWPQHVPLAHGVSVGRPRADPPLSAQGYLVDPASSICLSQRLSHASLSTHGRYSETANGSLNQLWFL